jgi:DNA-binding transcriptional regulator YiaG
MDVVKKDYMIEVKTIIKELNDKYKYSQADIARILEINQGVLSAWLLGNYKCSHPKMLCLAMRQIRVLLNEAFN